MSVTTPAVFLWAVEFADDGGLLFTTQWFPFRLCVANGPALCADYVSDEYLAGDLPIRALTTFEWRHRVVRVDSDMMRVYLTLHGCRAVSLGSANFHRDSLCEYFLEKHDLISYGTFNQYDLFLALSSFRTVSESDLSP